MLSITRDANAADQFFCKVLQASQARISKVISVNKHTVYSPCH